MSSSKNKFIAGLAGAAVVLGAAGVIAGSQSPSSWHSVAAEQSEQAPDTGGGSPDLPEPGDTADAGD